MIPFYIISHNLTFHQRVIIMLLITQMKGSLLQILCRYPAVQQNVIVNNHRLVMTFQMMLVIPLQHCDVRRDSVGSQNVMATDFHIRRG